MKQLLLLITCILFLPSKHETQGCAGIKNVYEVGQKQHLQADLGSTGSPWIVGINNRYFKSFRDFRAKVDLETPPRINQQNFYDRDIDFYRLSRYDQNSSPTGSWEQ